MNIGIFVQTKPFGMTNSYWQICANSLFFAIWCPWKFLVIQMIEIPTPDKLLDKFIFKQYSDIDLTTHFSSLVCRTVWWQHAKYNFIDPDDWVTERQAALAMQQQWKYRWIYGQTRWLKRNLQQVIKPLVYFFLAFSLLRKACSGRSSFTRNCKWFLNFF